MGLWQTDETSPPVARKRSRQTLEEDPEEVILLHTQQGVIAHPEDDEETREKMERWLEVKREAQTVSLQGIGCSDDVAATMHSERPSGPSETIDSTPGNVVLWPKVKLPNFKRIPKAAPETAVASNTASSALERPTVDVSARDPRPRQAAMPTETTRAPEQVRAADKEPPPDSTSPDVSLARTREVCGDVGFLWSARVHRPSLDTLDAKQLKPKGGTFVI